MRGGDGSACVRGGGRERKGGGGRDESIQAQVPLDVLPLPEGLLGELLCTHLEHLLELVVVQVLLQPRGVNALRVLLRQQLLESDDMFKVGVRGLDAGKVCGRERRTENGERIERIRVLAIVLGKGISDRAEVAVQGERGFSPCKVPPMEVAREYKGFLSYSQQPHLTVSNK